MSDSLSVPWTRDNSKHAPLPTISVLASSVPSDTPRRRSAMRSSVTSGPTSGRSYASSPRWRKWATTSSTRSVTNQSSSYGAPTVFCGRCPMSAGARATCIKEGAGRAAELRCPFHGWRYGLDGSLLEIVNDWDFPVADSQRAGLPRFAVETWSGFVFVSLASEPEPLSEFLGPVRDLFAGYMMEKRYRQLAVSIVVPCHWKVALAAFPEIYHVPWTHPQLSTYSSDVDSSFEILGKHGKLVHAMRPSPKFPLRGRRGDLSRDSAGVTEQDTALRIVRPGPERVLRGSNGTRASRRALEGELCHQRHRRLDAHGR